MNTSTLFTLNSSDFIKGVTTAVLAGLVLAVGTVLHGVIIAPGFDIFSIDWSSVLHDMVNAAIVGAEGGFAGYIAKNFLSDENGAVLGAFGGNQ